MLIQRVNEYSFRKAFEQLRPDNFSYDGLTALYDHLEELSEDIGDIVLDVIAICCDFSEYENLKDFQNQHSDEYQTIEQIAEQTTVILVGRVYSSDDRFIIANF